MPAKPAPPGPPADFLSTQPKTVEFDFTFRLITPMFGGGVEINGPQKPHDPITPIRVPSIRGQLRFWWRACNPARATTAEELFKAEEAIWGSTKEPSKVQIRLDTHTLSGEDVNVYQRKNSRPEDPPNKPPAWEIRPNQRDIAYGVFPLKPDEGSRDEPGQLFDLRRTDIRILVCCDASHQGHVRTALTAWSLFGGIGARTRRGFGSVESDHHTIESIDTFLDAVRQDQPLTQPWGVPSLVGAKYEVGRAALHPRDAWANALTLLAKFRQHRRNGTQPRRPGRSYWPEPEQIRALTTRDPKHQPLPNPVDSFPRAAFGLPIIFHFQSKADPPDTTLNPVGLHRFASPLILRALRSNSNSRYLPLALVLGGTSVPMGRHDLELAPKGFSIHKVTRSLTSLQAMHIPRLHGSTDPLAAFLDFFAKP